MGMEERTVYVPVCDRCGQSYCLLNDGYESDIEAHRDMIIDGWVDKDEVICPDCQEEEN